MVRSIRLRSCIFPGQGHGLRSYMARLVAAPPWNRALEELKSLCSKLEASELRARMAEEDAHTRRLAAVASQVHQPTEICALASTRARCERPVMPDEHLGDSHLRGVEGGWTWFSMKSVAPGGPEQRWGWAVGFPGNNVTDHR